MFFLPLSGPSSRALVRRCTTCAALCVLTSLQRAKNQKIDARTWKCFSNPFPHTTGRDWLSDRKSLNEIQKKSPSITSTHRKKVNATEEFQGTVNHPCLCTRTRIIFGSGFSAIEESFGKETFINLLPGYISTRKHAPLHPIGPVLRDKAAFIDIVPVQPWTTATPLRLLLLAFKWTRFSSSKQLQITVPLQEEFQYTIERAHRQSLLPSFNYISLSVSVSIPNLPLDQEK